MSSRRSDVCSLLSAWRSTSGSMRQALDHNAVTLLPFYRTFRFTPLGLAFRFFRSSNTHTSLPIALATHDNSGAAGLRPPPLFSTINPGLNLHAIRSAVRLPRASQPCSYPWAGTSSDRARCPTASRLSARGHGRAEVATVFPAAATETRESREARTHSSSPLIPTTLAWIPPITLSPAVVISSLIHLL